MLSKLNRCLVFIAGIALTTGCSTVWQSTYETSVAAFKNPEKLLTEAKLDSHYRYLRFEVNQHPVLLILGFVDVHPEGPVEVWYGGDPVMVKLQNGRYVASKGLQTNWQDVHIDQVPDFASLNQPQRYLRTRQQAPGAEFGIRETVVITPLNQAPDIAPKLLKEPNIRLVASGDNVDVAPIRWFSEVVVSASTATMSKAKLPAFYAVEMASKPKIIFGYQCLKADYCISWQAWPATAAAK
ncbi:MAG: YjbF family lipoprotein [Pseudomonadota bacterium]